MLESILADIDAEIARLQAAKAILTSGTTAVPVTVRKRGRPAKTSTPAPKPSPKRRTMSAEARERIRQGQVKRWASAKKTTKSNLYATVAPLPKTKKKASKSAA